MSKLDTLRSDMRRHILADEEQRLADLVAAAGLDAVIRERIADRGAELVRTVRNSSEPGIMEAFLAEYGLSTQEGVALMCLAEALLRVPDAETIDELIQDKIVPHRWGEHIGDSGSTLVNASTWALMLTGRVLDEERGDGVVGALRGMVRRLGEPVIRVATGRAMREMGEQFVLGRDIQEAMRRGQERVEQGYTYSYDMLGEAARTEDDAARYHGAYSQAIAAISQVATGKSIRENPGISVKLSALHPRYEYGQKKTMLPEMTARTLQLVRAARDANIGFNIDAEEQDRLDLSLDVIEAVLADESLDGWDGFGVVVQAYGARAAFVIDWLCTLAEKLDRRIMVRLVKGAYWDTEIKRAQVLGLDGFPVFTRKVNTDVSYISCARQLLANRDRIYPQFATHNAHTVAAVLELAGKDTDGYEFQRLHGMGESLHEAVRETAGTRCRIYAPVGRHQDLLAYLVRRLLENGANSSFVHQIMDESVAPETIAGDPFAVVESQPAVNPAIEKPSEICGAKRRNAKGWDITDPLEVEAILAERERHAAPHAWQAERGSGAWRDITNPARPDEVVGRVREATAADVDDAVIRAGRAQADWAAMPATERGDMLCRVADLYEEHAAEFFALAAREAGKTLLDAVAEVREAVDFLRYYASEAPNVERDTEARGVIVCISPWNFPLAIFTGQISAALATGNAVIAKPAEQTPLIASRAVELMHAAGVPEDVLILLPGDGESVGAPLTAHPDIAGVCFTGSTEVARLIERQLAKTAAVDAMLIAETGGLNAMIVDSTALPEQAVRDILASAFQSAGQRCSALRVLLVQRDVEARLSEMLLGAMDSLVIGDPWELATDVGPVIDAEAQQGIQDYCTAAEGRGQLVKSLDIPPGTLHVAPTVLRVKGIGELEREVFGPVLHVARFDAERIDDVVAAINDSGYGLTFGLHTRIDMRVQEIIDSVEAGNLYINRNQIGAIVGSQPFGGRGLSGTGPKAGGPHYLKRFRKTASADGAFVEHATNGDAGRSDAGSEASGAVVSVADTNAAFDTLDGKAWASRRDRIAVLRDALRGKAAVAMAAAAAIDAGAVDLPGPTGESNRLDLVPRGRVLCLGPGPDIALSQAVQALRMGNSVLVVADGAQAAVSPLVDAGLPIRGMDGRVDPASLTTMQVDLVALAGDVSALRSCRQALADRDGAIVPLVIAAVEPIAYAHERAVCVDTTAAGGNAALLARAG